MKKLLLTILFPVVLFGQTAIYRSVQPGNTSAIAVGTGNNLTISGTTATFASALPDTVGVGCAIQYDDDNDGDIDANDSICFIHGRTSSTVFAVANAAGGTPTATAAADQDWSIFHAYVGNPAGGSPALNAWDAGDENTGIDADLRNFDAGNRNTDTANESWFVALYSGVDSGNVIIDGWDTSADDSILIFTPYLSSEVGTSQRHSGKYGSGYRLGTADESGTAILVNDDTGARITFHIRIDGLAIFSRGQSGIFINSTGDDATADVIISNCIIRGSAGASAQSVHNGIYIWDNASGGTRRVWNNIIYDFVSSGTTTHEAGIYHQHGTTYAYHNTVVGNAIGIKIELNGTFSVKNNICNDNTDNYNGTYSAAWGITHNITDVAADTTVFSVAAEGNDRVCEVAFVDEANDNFLLSPSDPTSCARNNGTDLTADTNLPVAISIESRSRPQGAAVDIGASEVSESSARGRVIIIGAVHKLGLLFLALIITGATLKRKQ